MISAVDKVNINVRDQGAARRFWIETMGFSLVTDEPIRGGVQQRALDRGVRPPRSAVTLVLYSLHVRRQQARLTVPGAVPPAMTFTEDPPGADRPRRGVP